MEFLVQASLEECVGCEEVSTILALAVNMQDCQIAFQGLDEVDGLQICNLFRFVDKYCSTSCSFR